MLLRTGRILVVEPEPDLRDRLDLQLVEAGHDVASVPDDERAADLLTEGLDPDVVVAELEAVDRPAGRLRSLAPLAAHVRIDRTLSASDGFQDLRAVELVRCTPDPLDIMRRVEEALLQVELGGRSHDPADPAGACLDLARRLASALPSVDDPVTSIFL